MAKYPRACECLRKGQEVHYTVYGYPAEHWRHIRTVNPTESTPTTVRHRSRQTKCRESRAATLAMVFELARDAEGQWRKLDGCQQTRKVTQGVRLEDRGEAGTVQTA